MSELRSAAESFRGDDLAPMPLARVEDDFAELQRACELLELERLRRLAELDRRGIGDRDGHLSTASWLSKTHRVAYSVATANVNVAKALEEMPETRRSLEDGEISMSSARVLVSTREADPEIFASSEAELVEATRRHGIRDLHRVLAFWRQRAERERGSDTEERLREPREFHASRTFLGMVRVDGDLDPETGETLLTALGAVLDSEARSRTDEDSRSPTQRRADALGEVCRQWLERSDRPNVGGERPHLTVTVDVEALENDGDAELDRCGAVPGSIARRIACDASIMRVVMSSRSEPLDVGRRTPVIPPSMRRAVLVRDRQCRFPGCERPHPWCDAHHVQHWADGGPTTMSNLLLLCRRHHRLIHRPRGFSVEVVDSRPVFRRPDGSILDDGAPP